MKISDCEALLSVINRFLSIAPHSDRDLADLFDLLGQLEQRQKQAFWAWLGANAPNVKKWLMAKGGGHKKPDHALKNPLKLKDILATEDPKLRVALSCQWYEAHKPLIQSRLPLEVRGESGGITLYQSNWDISYWANKWRAGTLPVSDADRYIPGQLGPLVAVFDDAEVTGRAA